MVFYIPSYAIVNHVKIFKGICIWKILLQTVKAVFEKFTTSICNCFYVDCIIQETFTVVKSGLVEFLYQDIS